MISLPQFTPMIRVGPLRLAPCEESWLRGRLETAAAEAGRGEFWPTADIARGVIEYLEQHYEGSAIDLTALIGKIRALLVRVGCADIAGLLDPSPPPVPVSLTDLAASAGNGFELFFFEMLRQELDLLADHGVRQVQLNGLHACVRLLRRAGKWRRDCAELADEIVAFVRWHEMTPCCAG